ncbi:hypothetical protein CgunFtcFv8_014829 [Champsocephalus gunnari]|uniref:Uncharacterized protein n=1 Tax=Champsocephalus gunnari TaxID=52237 RepID=A0AAN8HZ33_CHAGU|nr:hypothetical protein CgunFtcFv8_014829 [Champsocephalus gunnari]
MSGGVQGTLARVQIERMGPRCLYPWMDPRDPPTGTDDQTEDGGRQEEPAETGRAPLRIPSCSERYCNRTVDPCVVD